MKSRLCFVLVWTLVCTLGACVSHRPEPLLTDPRDPAATVRVVREREAGVQSLRAGFTAITLVEGRRWRTNGLLLVGKPDRIRLRLWTPYGPTVFDFIRRGDGSQVNVPFDTSHPTPEDTALFSPGKFEEVFLRGRRAFPGSCEASIAGDGDHVATCRSESTGAVERVIRIDPLYGTVKRELSYGEGGEVRMILTFQEYRTVGGVPLPYYVEVIDPGQGVSVEVTVQRYDLNLKLPEVLFQ